MTQDEVIGMAREAGVIHPEKVDAILVRFANLVEARAIKDHAMYEVQRLGQEIETEPVAWYVDFGNDDEPNYASLEKPNEPKATIRPLVFGDTSPPQRQWVGLTPQERDEINEQVYGAVPHHVAFHAAIETKLKQKNGYAEEKNT